MATEIQLYESVWSPDLPLLDFFLWGWMNSKVDKIKVDTRGDLFVRVLEINSEEEHVIFAHELQSALSLIVGFSNIYCELWEIGHFSVTNSSVKTWIVIKIKLWVFYLFVITIHNAIVFGDSQISIPVTIHVHFFSHSDWYYHPPKYWRFFVNHSAHTNSFLTSQRTQYVITKVEKLF
jgi:predicted membrane protein